MNIYLQNSWRTQLGNLRVVVFALLSFSSFLCATLSIGLFLFEANIFLGTMLSQKKIFKTTVPMSFAAISIC